MADLRDRGQVRPITLPYRGIPYGESMPGGEVQLAAMTAKDWKLLSGSGSRGPASVDLLLDRLLDAGSLGYADFVMGDRAAVLIELRDLSLPGEPYGFNVRCPECSEQFRYEIQSLREELEYTEAPDDWKEPFECTLPDCGTRLSLRLPRGTDEKYLAEFERKQRQRANESGDAAFFMGLARLIVAKGGEKVERPITVVKFIEGLSLRDLNALTDAMDDNSFGFSALLDLTCPACGWQMDEVRLPMGPEFFRPRRRRRNVRTDLDSAARAG